MLLPAFLRMYYDNYIACLCVFQCGIWRMIVNQASTLFDQWMGHVRLVISCDLFLHIIFPMFFSYEFRTTCGYLLTVTVCVCRVPSSPPPPRRLFCSRFCLRLFCGLRLFVPRNVVSSSFVETSVIKFILSFVG